MSGFATNEFWCQSRKKHLVFRIIWISEFQIWDCSPVDNQGMFVGFMSNTHAHRAEHSAYTDDSPMFYLHSRGCFRKGDKPWAPLRDS